VSSAGSFANWGRTASCKPCAIVRPSDENELIALLRRAAAEQRPVKVVGGGHSWSDIACTDGYQVNLDRLEQVISVDRARQRITVQAGLRLHRLVAVLHSNGLALPVVGSILEQSVAGAISTATHGSAPAHGNLACQVEALRMVLADGSVRTVRADEEPDLLSACRVSLGALGIITEVTLRCVPAFTLREVAMPMDFDEAVATLPQLLESAPYLKLWWLPHTQQVLLYRCWPLDPASLKPSRLPAVALDLARRLDRWTEEKIVSAQLFDGLLRLSARRPGIIGRMNRAVRAAYFRPRTRVGASAHVLTIGMPPRHQECEYAVPVAAAGPMLRALRRLIDEHRLTVNFPAEFRFVAADDSWLSPMHGRASCCIGAYIAGGPALDHAPYFGRFEELMQSVAGRPHWGKQFQAPATYLHSVYPRLGDFAALRRKWDPEGRFLNGYLRRIFDDVERPLS